MKPALKPFDVVVVDGLWYMPHHWLIRWRGLDTAVHCLTVMNEDGFCWNPLFTGIAVDSIDKYRGRTLSIHRYKGELDYKKMTAWANAVSDKSKGYDFFRQWLMGFVCGMATKTLANDESKWTCAEFPYWAFQENEYKITSKEEDLPMPRLFRYNDHFETIFEGVWI